jgi:hypothetical protein
MPITNPQAVTFTNQQVRPLAEELRAIKARIDSLMVDWFGGMNAIIPNDNNELLEDGREAQGVSRLDGDDIVGFITVAQAVQATLNTAGYTDRIAKPCVRPLEAN